MADKYITPPKYSESVYSYADDNGTRMASFGGHVFLISPTVIRSFDSLAITAGSDTENKTADGENYVTRKNGKAKKVTMNVTLSALLGCDPRSEMEALVHDAETGKTAYLYIGQEKLFTCPMMLTDANGSDIVIAPSGQWISCKVALTFQQAAKNDGGYAKIKVDDTNDDDTSDEEETEETEKAEETEEMPEKRESAVERIARLAREAAERRSGYYVGAGVKSTIDRITYQD